MTTSMQYVQVPHASANSPSVFFASRRDDVASQRIQPSDEQVLQQLGCLDAHSSDSVNPGVVIGCHSSDVSRIAVVHGQLPALVSLAAVKARPNDIVLLSHDVLNESVKSGVTANASWDETILREAMKHGVTFVVSDSVVDASLVELPSLSSAACNSLRVDYGRLIQQVVDSLSLPSTPDAVALSAGLLLMNDLCDASHSKSQSIEGRGRHRSGDYWHAILHRREPDYGNAKYWFRHVGRHPIFIDMERTASRLHESADSHAKTALTKWFPQLVAGSEWHPYAFVDLCEFAVSNPTLAHWCEAIQFEEMLRLLTSTWSDAAC